MSGRDGKRGLAAPVAGGGSGYAPGGTDVAVADGGTGASTAAAARTNLDVQRQHMVDVLDLGPGSGGDYALAFASAFVSDTHAHLRAGTYVLAARCLVDGVDNLTITADPGAIIQVSAAGSWGASNRHALLFQDCTNLHIEGVEFDGNGAALTGTTSYWAVLGVESSYASQLDTTKTSSDITVEHCTFHDLRSYGLVARLVDGLTVYKCEFAQGHQDASNLANQCAIARCDNATVDSCEFDGGANSSLTEGTIRSLLVASPGGQSGDPWTTALNFAGNIGYRERCVFTAPSAASATPDAVVDYSGLIEFESAPEDYINNDFYFLCASAGTGANSDVVPSSAMKVTAVNEASKTFTVTRYKVDDAGGTTVNWAGQDVFWTSIKTSRFCKNIHVRHCNFRNSGASGGVFLLGVDGFTINDCYATACEDIGLDTEWSINGDISQSRVHNPTGSTGIAVLFLTRNVRVSHNIVTAAINHGILHYSGYTVTSNLAIDNNVLRGCPLLVVHNSGQIWDNVGEGISVTDNHVRGGPTASAGGLLKTALQVGRATDADRGGFLRDVKVQGNTLAEVAQRGLVYCGVDGLDIEDNTISATGYDAIFDANTLVESTRVELDGNRFSEIGSRSPSGMGALRTVAAVTDAPRWGINTWRNVDSALDSTQAWYRPADTPTAITLIDGSTGVIYAPMQTAAQVDVASFTSTGAWTKPAWAKTVTLILLSGGSGGGSGRRGAAATVRCGGGGGAGGSANHVTVPASVLPATLTATVGAGGAGGAAVATDDTDGNNGTTGGHSRAAGTGFTLSSLNFGGGNGKGGTATTGTAGSGVAPLSAGSGAAASASGGAGGTGNVGGAGGAGGGAGGGITVGNAASAGGGGAANYATDSSAGTAGTVDNVGGAGAAATNTPWGGASGGGGGASITTVGGTGGAGGNYGSGGGGGGASLNGNNSGAGGNGSPGIVVIISEG